MITAAELLVAEMNATAEALDGVAMRTNDLLAVVGNKSQLFRKPKGGMEELRQRGPGRLA
jgi:hypothetical protein